MLRILFVCHGNICRSPMAEYICRDLLQKQGEAERFRIASAATSTEEIRNGTGNPVYPPAVRELARHGISCEGKRAVLLQKEDYNRYDFLLGMDSENIRHMNRLFGGDPRRKIRRMTEWTGGQDIEDPWYSGRYDRVYREIEEGCRAWLKVWLPEKEPNREGKQER